jgi:replicative DNA helicase
MNKEKFLTAPFNQELEYSVLQGVMMSPDVCEVIMPSVSERHFYGANAKALYSAISKVYKNQGRIDISSVAIELEADAKLASFGGQSGLIQLTPNSTSYSNCEVHLDRLQQYKVKREVIEMAQGLIADAMDPEKDGFAIADTASEKATKLTETSGLLQTASIDEHIRRFEDYDMQPFRINEPDMMELIYNSGGIQPGHIDLTVAESGHGKTQYAMYKAILLARNGYKTHWFQLEDYGGKTALKFKQALGELSENIVIADNVFDIDDIKREARQIKREFDTNNIVIDYVQEIVTKGRSKTEEVEAVTRSLTSLAKELHVCMHLTSQITIVDTKRKNWQLEPRVNDVRWSKQLKQAAHTVVSVFRPYAVEGLADEDHALDWDGNKINKNLVFCRNIKNRYGEMTQKKLRLIQTESGLVNFNAWQRETEVKNNAWRTDAPTFNPNDITDPF